MTRDCVQRTNTGSILYNIVNESVGLQDTFLGQGFEVEDEQQGNHINCSNHIEIPTSQLIREQHKDPEISSLSNKAVKEEEVVFVTTLKMVSLCESGDLQMFLLTMSGLNLLNSST